MRLLPRDEKFWGYFTKQTAAVCLATDTLLQALKSGNGALPGAAVRIKTIEHDGAQTLRELQMRLHKTFVTPLDPEDISLLSEHLANVLDDLEGIAYRVAAYRLEPVPALLIELSDRTHRAAEAIEKAFGLLSRDESIEEPAAEILAFAEEGKQTIREGVTQLYAQQDAIAVIKNKEVFDIFEQLHNSCRDLANALQNVSIKNA